ncbi:acetyltransferase domain protein [Streptococcus sanguinis]|uniref:GNAT family N-acetyltransferase n=1 Tax=Streptococcus sanguinis TaxID=1305 RepID=UPI000779D4AB|nr:GNAT family N-acetyltransferase [Streptococcus sanguinis]MBZ2039641.1 GNAT family N-acetyltransferase [Streptococcus sanguinis]MCC3171350.1 acetyltransferase domain protein [Streptococcus sanguinis]
MSLTSQIITAEFPDLDKVEALNHEAFPVEERVPISEFLRYTNDERSHFFAFYNEEEFVGFAFAVYNEKMFYVSFFAIMQHLRSHGYGGEIIHKLTEFYQKTMVLEVERVDEECDNLEQRQARMDFYKRNGFRTTNAFLEYEGLSFEILYLGHHFDEEAYRDIFHMLQEKNFFEFEIKYRRFSDV